MSRRVMLTCRACKFTIATPAPQVERFGWRFEDGRPDALCPACVTTAGGPPPTPTQVAPALGLVRQSPGTWDGELLRRPPARFLGLERRPSPRARGAGMAGGGGHAAPADVPK